MSFLTEIENKDKWLEFYESLKNNPYSLHKEDDHVLKLIETGEYLNFKNWIVNKEYLTTPIVKKEIIVSGKDKRRIVYCYEGKYIKYQYLFKFINFTLGKYDNLFSNNLYSFRKNRSINTIVRSIKNSKRIYAKCKMKIDITDYFRSINTSKLLDILKEKVDDKDFIDFIESYLTINHFVQKGKVIEDNAGVFPGNPIAGFLSNLYITDIDQHFSTTKVNYYRYADDIILMCKNKEELDKNIAVLMGKIHEKGLDINPKKMVYFSENTNYHFLGLLFTKKGVSISEETMHKIKNKIKRSVRKIARWCEKTKAPRSVGLKILIKKYNAKFFGLLEGEQSWLYWYFPYITDDKKLKEVDEYFQQEARFLYTGRHSKMNYKEVPYSMFKKLGYKTLTNQYYKLIKNNNKAASTE